MKPNQKLCVECEKARERCRAVAQMPDGEILWVCRACWRALGYDEFMYNQSQSKGVER